MDPPPNVVVPHVYLDIYDKNGEKELNYVQGEMHYDIQR